jgi:hypothetical protein
MRRAKHRQPSIRLEQRCIIPDRGSRYIGFGTLEVHAQGTVGIWLNADGLELGEIPPDEWIRTAGHVKVANSSGAGDATIAFRRVV